MDKKAKPDTMAESTEVEIPTPQPVDVQPEAVTPGQQLEEEKNRYVRLLADFSNYKKRAAAEREEILKFSNEAFVMALLPTLDNFDRALSAAQNHSSEAANGLEELVKGVALIKKQLEDSLERLGVKPIEAMGKPFDPHFHEAIMKRESDAPHDQIIEVVQKGYLFHNKVVRPAMVIVSGK